MSSGGPELLSDPLAQQLLASTIPARFAYVWPDGSPRVVSLWFHWTGRDLVLATFGLAPKVRALRSGQPVALTIDTEAPPNHVLSVRGRVDVREVRGVVHEYALAAERYLGHAAAAGYLGSLPAEVPMLRIAVQPERVVLLDFESRFPSALRAIGLVP
jgi:hypothetical protein